MTRIYEQAQPATIDEPSFAEAILVIEAATDLTDSQKRHWQTSLRQMSFYLDRPLSSVPARIAAIGPAVRKLHPEYLGINDKTFANHRSNVKAALLWFDRLCGTSRLARMAPEYRALLDMVEDRYAKDMLSPFLRYLSAHGIRMQDVSDEILEKFITHRKETSFSRVKPAWPRQLVRHWNRCSETVEGWPANRLTEPPQAKRHGGPAVDEFPPGLLADIETYCANLQKHGRRTADGRRLRPCKQSTVATRRRELVAAVRAAIEAGIPLEELTSLREFLRPDRAEKVVDYYWRKNGEKPSQYTIELAWKFAARARELGLPQDELEKLEDLAAAVNVHRPTGLTRKNRDLIGWVIQENNWAKVIQLPDRLMAQARALRVSQPERAAVTAQMAVAICILSYAPVRISNLTSIDLSRHLTRPGGRGTSYMLSFEDHEVKNREALQFPLAERVTRLIDEYVHDFRPRLLRGHNHYYLFPGDAGQKDSKTLSEQISKRLLKALGRHITPHQFRHAAGAIFLRKYPGEYETVRRFLGHRSIKTTTAFYTDLETRSGSERFQEIVTDLSRIEVKRLAPRRARRIRKD